MTKTNLALRPLALPVAICFALLLVALLLATGDDKDDRQAAAEYQQEMVGAGHWDCAEHDKAMETR